MSVDFTALVHALVASVADVRACVMVSREGLALGASPAHDEEKALAAWSNIAALGEVDRGFVGLQGETWVFCRRGPYAALATASPSARPGLILDRLEEMLLVAEEVRLKKEPFRAATDRETGSLESPRGPRTSLHREPREEPVARSVPPWPARGDDSAEAPALDPIEESAATETAENDIVEQKSDEATPDESSWTVDTIALRREFAGILMPPEKRDEDS
jgi:hypothetical protein